MCEGSKVQRMPSNPCIVLSPNIGTKPCPLCDNQTAELSHFEHFINCHSPLVSSEFIVELLAGGSEDIFVHAKHFI